MRQSRTRLIANNVNDTLSIFNDLCDAINLNIIAKRRMNRLWNNINAEPPCLRYLFQVVQTQTTTAHAHCRILPAYTHFFNKSCIPDIMKKDNINSNLSQIFKNFEKKI